MQTRSRILHDLTRVAGGAVSTAVGVKDEIEAILRHRLERLVQSLDLVSREELEAVREVAIRAREEQERLTERLAQVEARMAQMASPARVAPRGAKGRKKTAKS